MSQPNTTDMLSKPPPNARSTSYSSAHSAQSVSNFPGMEDILIGDGIASQPAADLLGHALELQHSEDPSKSKQPQDDGSGTFSAAHIVDKRPWYRKPSVWW